MIGESKGQKEKPIANRLWTITDLFLKYIRNKRDANYGTEPLLDESDTTVNNNNVEKDSQLCLVNNKSWNNVTVASNETQETPLFYIGVWYCMFYKEKPRTRTAHTYSAPNKPFFLEKFHEML